MDQVLIFGCFIILKVVQWWWKEDKTSTMNLLSTSIFQNGVKEVAHAVLNPSLHTNEMMASFSTFFSTSRMQNKTHCGCILTHRKRQSIFLVPAIKVPKAIACCLPGWLQVTALTFFCKKKQVSFIYHACNNVKWSRSLNRCTFTNTHTTSWAVTEAFGAFALKNSPIVSFFTNVWHEG